MVSQQINQNFKNLNLKVESKIELWNGRRALALYIQVQNYYTYKKNKCEIKNTYKVADY